MATGTATLNFGATPSVEATILVTGLAGLTVATHKEAFVQGDDSTAGNDANAHKRLRFMSQLDCEFVSDTTMNINCNLIRDMATGTFVVHYVTA